MWSVPRREGNSTTEQLLSRLFAEFIGAFGFLFVGVRAISTGAFMVSRSGAGLNLIEIALANGFALGAMITAFRHISGAQFNAAATVAANSWVNHLVYWIGPLCGADIAGLVFGWCLIDVTQDREAG
jgi:glycerol uptake facilitator-like aquaporin